MNQSKRDRRFRLVQRLCMAAIFGVTFTMLSPLFSNEPADPQEDRVELFNGEDLTGWVGSDTYWSVEDGQIVGSSQEPIPQNEFLFTEQEFGDFYFAVSVRLLPNEGNSGIQFRSTRHDDGHAAGYQADIGEGWWGKLYHEHGRGLLDNTEVGLEQVQPNDWNRYEILAVGPHIWTAVNGHVSVAINDPRGERSGRIALQMHGGDPLEIRWKDLALVRNPPVELGGLGPSELEALLRDPLDAASD